MSLFKKKDKIVKVTKCDLCGYECMSEESLIRHKDWVHKDNK
jgi:hypothetical protein